jgi:hypothetical protein
MRRVTRTALLNDMYLGIRKALTEQRAALLSDVPAERNAAMGAVAQAMIETVDSETTCVVRADPVHPLGDYARPGIFGEDEPWPE